MQVHRTTQIPRSTRSVDTTTSWPQQHDDGEDAALASSQGLQSLLREFLLFVGESRLSYIA
eukprot:scaffold2257_cov424-Pavlova_lutheri.AAC.2